MTLRRVIVTGATGFVGRHTLASLVARGFEVHVIARRQPSDHADVVGHGIDLMDGASVRSLLATIRATHLLHLAWSVVPGQFWHSRDNLDWVACSLVLYRAFVASGGRRMVVAGTCAEYDWRHADLLDEVSTPCVPATLYGLSKHTLHQLLAESARLDGVSLAWGRLFFLYGPGEAPGRLVSDVTRALVRGEPALCGDGLAERDFMAVEDVAGALVALLASNHEGPVNVATGRCVPVRHIIETIATLAGGNELVRFGARPPSVGEPARLGANIARLRDIMGFQPSLTLEDGLAATVRWWRDGETDARIGSIQVMQGNA